MMMEVVGSTKQIAISSKKLRKMHFCTFQLHDEHPWFRKTQKLEVTNLDGQHNTITE